MKYRVNLKHAGKDLNLAQMHAGMLTKGFWLPQDRSELRCKIELDWSQTIHIQAWSLAHTVLATLASKDNLEIAQFSGDRTSYHKSTKPYIVKD